MPPRDRGPIARGTVVHLVPPRNTHRTNVWAAILAAAELHCQSSDSHRDLEQYAPGVHWQPLLVSIPCFVLRKFHGIRDPHEGRALLELGDYCRSQVLEDLQL